MNLFTKDAARAYHLHDIDAPVGRRYVKAQAHRAKRRAGKRLIARIIGGDEGAIETFRGRKSVDRRDVY